MSRELRREVCFVDTAADWESSRFESKRGFSAFNHKEVGREEGGISTGV